MLNCHLSHDGHKDMTGWEYVCRLRSFGDCARITKESCQQREMTEHWWTTSAPPSLSMNAPCMPPSCNKAPRLPQSFLAWYMFLILGTFLQVMQGDGLETYELYMPITRGDITDAGGQTKICNFFVHWLLLFRQEPFLMVEETPLLQDRSLWKIHNEWNALSTKTFGHQAFIHFQVQACGSLRYTDKRL